MKDNILSSIFFVAAFFLTVFGVLPALQELVK